VSTFTDIIPRNSTRALTLTLDDFSTRSLISTFIDISTERVNLCLVEVQRRNVIRHGFRLGILCIIDEFVTAERAVTLFVDSDQIVGNVCPEALFAAGDLDHSRCHDGVVCNNSRTLGSILQSGVYEDIWVPVREMGRLTVHVRDGLS